MGYISSIDIIRLSIVAEKHRISIQGGLKVARVAGLANFSANFSSRVTGVTLDHKGLGL